MIQVRHLEYTYLKSEIPAVRDVDFDVARGEVFGFLGPSGAGKSTTQKLLIRLLTGFRGTVEVLGRNLVDWDNGYYNHIGVGFELPNHYSKLTAIENLQFFAAFYDRPTKPPEELLDMVGLLKDGHKRVGEFSKGMKMRLNFVRSFLHDPELLFLDEPTSGLDPVNARNMKDIIVDLKRRGKTIFLTTHRMEDADELCDRVAFIVDGRIELIDSPRALKLRHGKRRVKVEFLNDTSKAANSTSTASAKTRTSSASSAKKTSRPSTRKRRPWMRYLLR
jgi:fluoroquinolone transport system ATP-binding protein